jgi:predicted nucleic acid-binding protein
MKFVLDSNVAVKWYLPEANSAKALQLRADFLASVHELLAPDIFTVEFGHAMTRAERQGIIAPGDADLHYVDLLTVGLPLRSSQPILRRAIGISSAARIGVYDCLYVALAENEGCELVTADDRLLKNLQAQFPFVRALASVP